MYMLNHLSIKNFQLLQHVELDLHEGMNVVSGTTGAGKSMLIQALKLLLGNKASQGLFDHKQEKVVLSGEFSGNDCTLNAQLEERGISCEDKQILIRREITPSGQNRCFINDTSVTVTYLRQVGERLIDFHGQHEGQAVLKPSMQREILDRMANNQSLLTTYKGHLSLRQTAMEKLDALRTSVHEREDRIQLLQFKAKDIDAINPQSGEVSQLEQQINRLKNKSQIGEHLETLNGLVSGNEDNVQSLMGRISSELETLSVLDDGFSLQSQQAQSAMDIIDELSYALADQSSSGFDADDFDSMQERLFSIKGLEKKFARSIDDIIAYRAEIQEELNTIENIDAVLADTQAEIKSHAKNLIDSGNKLHQRRHKHAKSMNREINHELKELALPNAAFKVNVTKRYQKASDIDKLTGINDGLDEIVFTAILNKGADFQAIKGMASGGETARIMLAIKKVIATHDAIGTLIFDEIDADTGGRLGNVLGEKMLEIANDHQLIAITHLPQVASYGHRHFKVEKDNGKKKAQTSIRQLSDNDRVEEMAHMMAGDELNDMASQHAKTMFDEAQRKHVCAKA